MPGPDVIARDVAVRAGEVARAAETGILRRIWRVLVGGLKGEATGDARPLAHDTVAISRQAIGKVRATTEAISRALDTEIEGKIIGPDRIRNIKSLIYMESQVNDQRYAGKKAISFPTNYPWTPDKGPYPQLWAMIPLEDVRIFAKGEKVVVPPHLKNMIRSLAVPTKNGPQMKQFIMFPIHWQQKDIVGKNYKVIQDGLAHVSASVRVVYMDPIQGTRFGDFSHTAIKMHLDNVAGSKTPIAGGLGGHRRIDAVWAEMSPAITGILEHMIGQKKFSPLVEIMPEALAMVDKANRGVIFRTLPEGEVFPAFSLYSPITRQSSKNLKLAALGGKSPRQNILAVDLLENLRSKNPKMSKLDAFRELFVDPIMDVNFSMFKEGMSMELHPQNFLFRFDPQTGRVQNVVIRDLHGFNYSADYRQTKGLPDLMTPEALKELGFPHITKETLKDYFEKEGDVKKYFRSPKLFEGTLDFFSSMWYFHTLDSLEKSGYMSRQEVKQAVEMIKDRVEFFARKYDFDLSILKQPTSTYDFVADPENGIRAKILFRRPVKKE